MNHRLEHIWKFFEQILPQHYSSEEIRITQVQMALNIAGILAPPHRIKVLIAQAPVGTGKTFAALIPSVYDTCSHMSRLIYSTSSLNLQAQLKNEELSLLKAKGEVENYVVAKGVTHYICLRKITDGPLPEHLKQDLIDYSMETDERDRVGFEKSFYPLSEDIWKKISLNAHRDCSHCSKRTICPTANHRLKFNDPRINVIVTNHNQLIQSVLNVQNDQTPILDFKNPGGVIIIDEAHDFEDAILSQLSEDLNIKTLFSAIRQIKERQARSEALACYNTLYAEVKSIRKRLETSRGRHTVPENCLQSLDDLKTLLNEAITSQTAERLDTQSLIRKDENESLLESCSELIQKILDQQSFAHWFNFDEQETAITVVNRRFQKYSQTIIRDLCINNRVVFMSGTLAVDGSFSHIYYSWGGRPPQSQELILSTVFDYPKQALVYVPEEIEKPLPSQSSDFQSYCAKLSQEILELIKITGGRTLILTTSHKQMELLYAFLKATLNKMGIKFLKQGDKSIELITDEFKQDETSVLIGTGSFFAGLSVPRKALVSVILCRLPFPPGDDPFLDLMAEGLSKKEKMEYIDFPRMVIRLLQAGGRLIRTIEDFGCFTILDPRVFNSSYSEKVLSELQKTGCKITRNRLAVKKFIQAKMNSVGFAKYPEYRRDLLDIPDILNIDDSPRVIRPKSSKNALTASLDNIITAKQLKFYKEVRLNIGMKPELLKSLKSPYDLYGYLQKIDDKRRLRLNLPETFPFSTEGQKAKILAKISKASLKKNSKVTTYALSPEELAKYQKTALKEPPKWGL